ncbi:MAG: hypothetical protein H6R13_3355 [Proteobacteria bacterium]|nr:hypothetical protein [Pseudomonadota bacterium]
MTSGGLLTVRAQLHNGHLQDLEVILKRPSVTRLFIGQLPDAVVKTVPYLFTLCAHAQRAAAQAAVAVAQNEVPRATDSAELWVEVLHENLWRLLLDWPPALGLHSAKAAFIAWRNARQTDEFLAVTQSLLHDTLRPLAEKCLENLVGRTTEEVAPESDVPEMSELALLAPEPWLSYWQGIASEMPELPRPASIRSVFQARLAEVEVAALALANGTPFPIASAGGEGWGVAQTLTARGVLTHAVHVVDGKVANYRVQAPTDGFFADAGALSSLLENCRLASLDQAKQVLNQAILALDPCLPYVVELRDA